MSNGGGGTGVREGSLGRDSFPMDSKEDILLITADDLCIESVQSNVSMKG